MARSKSGATHAARALKSAAAQHQDGVESQADAARAALALKRVDVKRRSVVASKVDAVVVPSGAYRFQHSKRGGNYVVELNIPHRTETVAKALGSRANLARVLKVAASQPTRWISGDESPNSENTRAIIDLEHVVARARLLWGDDDTVNSWLTGRNAFLDGARPVDVIAMQGSRPVIDALDQETAGAFA